MASLTNIRKLTTTERPELPAPRARSSSFSITQSQSTRSLNGELMDVINPVYWDHRISVDFDELEVGDESVDEEFAEELALKSPPQECWFHGKLDRSEAEQRLSEIHTPGAYLVRQSVKSPDTYCISFISSQGIIHFGVLFYTGCYFIGGRRFTCLSDIVGYYISYSHIVASETLKIPVPPKQGLVNTQTRIMAIDSYTQSQETEELSFRRGDVFVVLSEINEAWYWGKSNRTGETGMVPRDLFMDVTHKIDVCSGKPWYHENISRDRSQELVSQDPRLGSYMVRSSETPNVYVLIVKGISGPLKFKIIKEDYYFLGKRPYNSIDEIVNHYKKEPIHEQIYLGFAIPKNFESLPIDFPPLAPEEIEKKHLSFKEKVHSARMKERENVLKSGIIVRKERTFRTKWKTYYIQLHKDHKLVFKESEKATKAKHLLDLKNCSINHVHNSMYFKEHVFLIIDYSLMQKKTHIYLACFTKEDYDVWFDVLRTTVDKAAGKQKPNHHFRTIRKLSIGIESCEIQSAGTSYGPGYCVISIDNCDLGRTNIVQPTTIYKWNKEFNFWDLSCDLSTISIKFYTKGNISVSLHGETTLYFSTLSANECIEDWYKMNCKTGVRGKLRLKVIFQNEIVLPIKEYEALQTALLDPSLIALLALDSVRSQDRNSLGASLVQIMKCCHSTHILIPKIMEFEVKKSLIEAKSSMFRSTTLATSLMDHFMHTVGITYIQEVLTEHITTVINEQHSLEIDPLRTTESKVQENLSILLFHIRSLWEKIKSSVDQVPKLLKYILYMVRCQVTEKWPEDKLVGHKIVSCFLFLRFICPAITNPKLFSIIEDIPPNSYRSLTLVAKTLQNLANFAITPKEQYMRVFKHFLEDKQKEMRHFLELVSSQNSIPVYQSLELDASNDLAALHHKIRGVRDKLVSDVSPQVQSLVKASDILIFKEQALFTTVL